MSAWEIVRHQVAVVGTVSDTRSSEPLGGVDVRITDGPQAFLPKPYDFMQLSLVLRQVLGEGES